MSSRAYRAGRRLAPVPRQTRPHRCPALHCRIFIPQPQRIACSDHWALLPDQLRGRLNATYRRDIPAYLAAYREAVRLLTSEATSEGTRT